MKDQDAILKDQDAESHPERSKCYFESVERLL